jgi:hypothetical protein
MMTEDGDLSMAGNFIATLFREDPRGTTADPYNENIDRSRTD